MTVFSYPQHPIFKNAFVKLFAHCTAAIVFDTFASHSLRINLSAGKTEFLLALRGPGSKDFLTHLFAHTKPCIEVPGLAHGTVPVCVTFMYKHMGSKVSASVPEVKHRAYSAVDASSDIGVMLNSDKCDQLSELCLVRFLSLSRLRFNCASITQWHSATITVFDKGYFKVYRRALLSRKEDGE
jgi:hypothetical protein